MFDQDHAFANYDNVMSQTMEEPMLLYETEAEAQREMKLDLSGLAEMKKPELLKEEQVDKSIRAGKGIGARKALKILQTISHCINI